ncbi:DNA polymerase III subunit gamma/tau [Baaleninema simplex]|uniref:DNA polymerase III subunit gamma/tau n=1 Tax=Baaleninema simplex TaxID=2862350 RepID=UPI00036AAD44|nr:DNA polymerase III subunit gamma/tau [Baaleninema simplex]
MTTYEPLHHKYRPATFGDLVGQEAIASTLTNALEKQRIAPAYLFAGPRGTGKTSSARIMAKSLNCLAVDRPTATPCGTCPTCRAIANGSALDVIEIDAASNTGVDNIRELIERAQFAPVQCRYKVYVIDECHMLSTAAFNSLLKTLEEPPEQVIFILATTDPQRVLPTIISRCQRFDYRRIPLEAMVSHLKTIAEKEAIAIADDAVTLVAQISQGGLRDAESLLDQLSLLPERITVDRVWDLVGAVPEKDLFDLLEAIASNNPQSVLERCRNLLDRGREPPIVVQNLAGFYRDLLIAKTAPNRSDLVAVTPPTWAKLCEFAQQWDASIILGGSQHLRQCEIQIKNTTQPRLWLEVSLLGLLPSASNPATAEATAPSMPATMPARAIAPPTVSGGTPQTATPPTTTAIASPQTHESDRAATGTTPSSPVRPEAEEPASANSTAPSQPPSEPAIATPPATTHEPVPSEPDDAADEPTSSEPVAYDLPQIWQQVLDNIKMRATQELLRQQGQLLGFDGTIAQIGVSSGLMKLAERKVPDIEAAFQRTYQRTVRVQLEANRGNAPASAQSSRTVHQTSPPPQPQQPPVVPTPTPQARPIPTTETVAPPTPSPPIAASQSQPSSSDNPPWDTRATTPSPPAHNDPVQHAPAPNESRVWEEDELSNVADRFAEFFNGDVVSVDDDLDFEF